MGRLNFIAVIMLAVSCADNIQDPAGVLRFDVGNCRKICLEDISGVTMDPAITIGMVKDIAIKDSSVYIHSSSGLHRFSVNTGELITSFSRKGSGPEEYLSIWSYSFTDNYVQLYDMNRKRIMEYTYDGCFVRTHLLTASSADKPFQSITRMGNAYVGKRVFGSEASPELALYDIGFKYVKDIMPEVTLRSGLMLHPPFSIDHTGCILYCRYFSNDIYEILPNEVNVRYHIDFGTNSFEGDSRFRDEYEIIDYLNSSKRKFAVNFSNIQDDDSFLSFCYLYDSSKRLALYDKKSKESVSYIFFSDCEVVDQIARDDNSVYILTQDTGGVTRLYHFIVACGF